jgi:hypothetical protein
MASVIMLSVLYAQCHNYAHYVIMVNVAMLYVVAPIKLLLVNHGSPKMA